MFQPFMIIIYLAIINLAILIRVYRSYLKYLSPARGYAASFMIIASLCCIDLLVFNATQEEKENATQKLEVRSIGSMVNYTK